MELQKAMEFLMIKCIFILLDVICCISNSVRHDTKGDMSRMGRGRPPINCRGVQGTGSTFGNSTRRYSTYTPSAILVWVKKGI
jgi:hypothetical protein